MVVILGGNMTPEQKRIVVLYASCGAGHLRAAESLAEFFISQGEKVVLLDILATAPGWYRKIYRDGYYALIRNYPFVWKILYQITEKISRDNILKRIINRMEARLFKKFFMFLAEFKPQIIVTTHFLPVSLLEYTKKIFSLYVVITDYYAHNIWLGNKVDTYFVAAAEVKQILLDKGVAAEKIQVSGIPFKSPKDRLTRREARIYLGIAEDKFTLLILSGGAGMGNISAVLDVLQASNNSLQLLVNTGHNVSLRKKLEEKYRFSVLPIIFFGFSEEMFTYYAASDVIISKPGGLTVTECLAAGLPQILLHTIPGQEEDNARFVVRKKAGRLLRSVAELPALIQDFLQNPDALTEMKNNALNSVPATSRESIYKVIMNKNPDTQVPNSQ